MSDADDEQLAALEKIYEAVRDYARPEFVILARKVIHRLQRLRASGIYGDYKHKTLWDEYCHEVQEGPFDMPDLLGESPSSAWDHTLGTIIDEIIVQIPKHAAVLLSIFANWDLNDDETGLAGSIWSDGIKQVIESVLAKEAGARDMDKFN